MKKGNHYYTNGQIQIIRSDNDIIPDGFIRGGLSKNIGKSPHNKGQICVHLGVDNLYIDESLLHTYLNNGWQKGQYLSKESAMIRLQKANNTLDNKSDEDKLKTHELRSNSAKEMWSKRDDTTKLSICQPGLEAAAHSSKSNSKAENEMYLDLINIFGEDDIITHYNKDPRYPYHCDFYIKSKDLFIELNAYFTHGPHEFDPTNEEDLKLLEYIRSKQSKSDIKNQYDVFENIWTVYDKEKIQCAKDNKLNYRVYYNLGEYYADKCSIKQGL